MLNKYSNETGTRILTLLKALLKKPLSSQEMLRIIEDKCEEIYRPEIISKYIKTLKTVGINIKKTDGKYFVQENLEKTDFDENDLSIMLFIKSHLEKFQNEILNETVENAFQMIENSFSDKTKDLLKRTKIQKYLVKKLKNNNKSMLKKYENYCKDNLKIELEYLAPSTNNKNKFKISPLKLIYKKGESILIGFDCESNIYREFITKNIVSIRQTPQKNTGSYSSSVNFKLKNRLAKSYMLKPSEKIIERHKNYIIVSNNSEDHDLLIRRLIRYYRNCEVLYPLECRQKMINYISEMEKIYNE